MSIAVQVNSKSFHRGSCVLSRSNGEYTVHISRARFNNKAAICKGAAEQATCISQRTTDHLQLDIYLENLAFLRVVEREAIGVSC